MLAIATTVAVFHDPLGNSVAQFWTRTLGPLVAEDWQPDRQQAAVATSREAVSGEAAERRSGPPVAVPVAIGSGFEPVIFEIPAAPVPVLVDDGQTSAPFASPGRPHGGVLRFASGASFGFRLSQEDADTLLAIDLDGDGDFTNDGVPYRSPTEAFEVTVELPMQAVTGRDDINGAYRLWLYRTPEGEMRQVALTQFAGTVSVGGRSFAAYVVDNLSVDGDYTNDGIYVDWDRDGQIHPAREFVPPGTRVVAEGTGYDFRITY